MADNHKIIPINIEEQMKTAYIDYSMSVIVARALPDVRDGLKPVHRRILYGMSDLGMSFNRPHRKSARVVGEVLGKYHPHGDGSVYDAMVRMAQDWSLRYPLIDGQGNFGHIDGDSPAAMRYTEARLGRIAEEMLADIKKNTVDFELNFDDSLEEPSVLPARLPNLLINGASGIAVGMATTMLPHNLNEVVDGIVATVRNPDISVDELSLLIKAPDLPTGGVIYGLSGVHEAYHTGRGRVVVRGKTEITISDSGKETIIISEIPYQVNKSALVVKMAELVHSGRISGISGIRDESDRRTGIRIVVELKRDAIAKVVLSKLYKFTPLQSSYGINNIALVNGRPMTLNLKQLIEEFIKFRLEVIVRRTRYDLEKAEERAHILEGLLIALDNIDEIIELIRNAATVDDAKEDLMRVFSLSEAQAKAILDMRLQKLVGLERAKIKEEYENTIETINRLKEILGDENIQKEIIIEEAEELKTNYGDERKTRITAAESEISFEDMIADEEVVVTITHLGYVKRTKVSEYRVQGRGGRGAMGSKTRETDFIEHMFVATTHNYLLLFTESGRCHWLRVYEIPETTKTAAGRVIQNIIQIPREDNVKAYIIIEDLTDQEFINNHYILFCTQKGMIKKTLVEAFSRPRVNGINAITINEDDHLIEARLTNGNNEVVLANRNGRAIRFNESRVRPMGRSAAGVKGIKLTSEEDAVVGMVCCDPAEPDSIMVISEKGNGKRSLLEDYPLTNRGGKGVKTMQITKKTGKLVAVKGVQDGNQMMITTRSGIVIRMTIDNIRIMGRATQGVKVIALDEDDEIADVAIVRDEESGGEEE